MKRWIASVTIVLSIVATGRASAQDAANGPGKVEVTIIPGGWTHFTESSKTAEPSFGNYNLGGAFSYNFNRLIGVEGEAGGSIGVTQNQTLRKEGSIRGTSRTTTASPGSTSPALIVRTAAQR